MASVRSLWVHDQADVYRSNWLSAIEKRRRIIGYVGYGYKLGRVRFSVKLAILLIY